MPHQSDNIPWHLLASNLRWARGELASQIRVLKLPEIPGKLTDKQGGCPCGLTNLHPTCPAPESSDDDEFAQAFTQSVKVASKHKRAQYPEKYIPPSPSDVLLGDELVEKIESHLSKEMKEGPRLPFEQRIASAFLHPWDGEDCYHWAANKIGFLNLEVVKILLMVGELDPILQACAHPDVGLGEWYSAAWCNCMASPYDLGWDLVVRSALLTYIALNVALCFPEICDPTAGRTDETDYRHTAFYQYMLRKTTESYDAEATSYPHQRFFGIPRGHFCEGSVYDIEKNIDQNHWLHQTECIKCGHYGLLSFDEFLNLEGPFPSDQYQPLESDVESVRQELLSQDLPPELVLMIMNFADYKAKRVLKVPHDPLHPANKAELDRYLDQCWQIIVACDILDHELGGNLIDWQSEIHSVVKSLFHNRSIFVSASITGMTCPGTRISSHWLGGRGQGRGRGQSRGRGRGRGGDGGRGRGF